MSVNDLVPTCDDDDDLPPPSSQRSTVEVAVVATMAGFCDTRGNVPLAKCVPTPTRRRALPAVTRDEIYVLLYIDGATSIEQIAQETSFSLAETITIVVGLLGQGLVEVATEPS